MKILTPKPKKEYLLQQEIEATGYRAILPIKQVRVRAHRRTQKKIDKTILLFRGLLFSDAPNPYDFQYLKYAWMQDGKFAEVTDEEIETFLGEIEEITHDKPLPKIGDQVTIPIGPLRGQPLIVTKSEKGTIWGRISGTGLIISLNWVDTDQ